MKRAKTDPWQNFPHPSPRQWQADARPYALDAIFNNQSGIISAVMGSGKSALIGEIVQSVSLEEDEHIVITTPTVRLVEQLKGDIAERIPRKHIGTYYTKGKSLEPVTIACNPSSEELGRHINGIDHSCALWIADEVHRTESDTMHGANESIKPNSKIGFTATPFRADNSESLSLWETLVYEYGPQDAIRDGVVVPPKLKTYNGDSLTIDDACIEMIKEVVDEGPGMVNALTIEPSEEMNSTGAEQFAERLRQEGIEANTVHSGKEDYKNDRVMERLRHGLLDCVVHINQLAEGANFPWLKWLCMRRPVSSRTRFCQEVGRILRCHEDKEYGLILDPNDLFDEFGLNYEAVLAGGETQSKSNPDNAEEAAEQVDETLEEVEEAVLPVDTTPGGTPVKVLGPARAWLRKTKLAFESTGCIQNKINSTHWRSDNMTPKQKSGIESMKAFVKRIPDHHKMAAKTCCKVALNGDMTKGEASDLLSLLFAIKDFGWPDNADKLIDHASEAYQW